MNIYEPDPRVTSNDQRADKQGDFINVFINWLCHKVRFSALKCLILNKICSYFEHCRFKILFFYQVLIFIFEDRVFKLGRIIVPICN